ncbi:MAG: IS1/IS6 family transposase [Chloroflexi bacterium]|nr:IS1/IS6 family transposase [Chloroflexota bacterium]
MVEVVTQITCKYCGSEGVVKFGSYKGIQRYFCKSCQRKFKGDTALFGMRVKPEYITSALNLYYTGSSIKDVCNHLNQEFGYYPSKHVVFEWVDKYTSVAAKQFQDTKPQLGNTWIADETVIKLDKNVKVWFWDIIDSDTRFLIASRASLSRTTKDAQMLIDRAIKKAGKAPKIVITDKLASYIDVNYGKDAEHRQGGPFKLLESGENTSQIERFHGTIKDRTKVMRAFRSLETLHDFMNGYLVYYNYFKPNDALEGKTPAEAAKIDYQIKNWKDLCLTATPKRVEIETRRPTLRPKPQRITPPRPLISERRGRIPR